MRVREYCSIVEHLLEIKALKRVEEFLPANNVFNDTIDNYKCLEFSDEMKLNNEIIIKGILQRVCSEYKSTMCLFLSPVDKITRIRSYKGYIKSKISNPVDFLEREITFDATQSYFIGAISLKENLQQIIDNLFFDSASTFIYSSNYSIDQEAFVNELLAKENCIKNNIFNYYFLVIEIIKESDIILRSAGSDLSEGIQVFLMRNNDFFNSYFTRKKSGIT